MFPLLPIVHIKHECHRKYLCQQQDKDVLWQRFKLQLSSNILVSLNVIVNKFPSKEARLLKNRIRENLSLPLMIIHPQSLASRWFPCHVSQQGEVVVVVHQKAEASQTWRLTNNNNKKKWKVDDLPLTDEQRNAQNIEIIHDADNNLIYFRMESPSSVDYPSS